MTIRLISCAEEELVGAVTYYNEQRPGLGYEFAAEVQNTLGRISAFPEAWPPLSLQTRRCITNRFPYGVIYQVRKDFILVVALMHLSKDPIHWQERLREANANESSINTETHR